MAPPTGATGGEPGKRRLISDALMSHLEPRSLWLGVYELIWAPRKVHGVDHLGLPMEIAVMSICSVP